MGCFLTVELGWFFGAFFSLKQRQKKVYKKCLNSETQTVKAMFTEQIESICTDTSTFFFCLKIPTTNAVQINFLF